MRIVRFNGQVHRFPAEATDEQIAEALGGLTASQGDVRRFEQEKAKEDDRDMGSEAVVAALRGASQSATDIGKAALRLTPLGTAAEVLDRATGRRASRALGPDALAIGEESIQPTREDAFWTNLGGEMAGGLATGGASPKAAVRGVAAIPAASRKLLSAANPLAKAAHFPMVGKTIAEQAMSPTNQKTVVGMLKRHVGIADDLPLNQGVLDDLGKVAGKAYDDIRAVKDPVLRDAPLMQKLAELQQRYGSADVRTKARNAPILKEIKSIQKRWNASPRDVLNDIQSTRAEAKAAFREGNNDLGRARQAMANAMEEHIERWLSVNHPNLMDKFRAARASFAKIEDVGDVLVPGTENKIDPNGLLKLLREERPISGELKAAAEFAANNRGLLKPDISIAAGNALMDPLMGIGAMYGTGDWRGMLAAFARPTARTALRTLAERAATKGNEGARREALRLLAISQSGQISERVARVAASSLAALNQFVQGMDDGTE